MGEAILSRNGIPVSGGTITGSLKFLRGTRIDEPLRLYAGDENANGLVIQAGGLTVVGGGEAGTSLYNALTTGNSPAANAGTEQLHLAADTTVNIHTNCNTIANRKTVTIDATGKITAPGGFGGNATNVTGVVAVANGGTGKNTAPLGLYNLINGSAALASNGLATGDFIPLGDVSASTGKKVTLANLVSYLNGNVVPSNIVVGSYTGDSIAGRVINLGFNPRAVMIVRSDGLTANHYTYSQISGGLAIQGGDVCLYAFPPSGSPDYNHYTWNKYNTAIQIVSNGFKVNDTNVSEHVRLFANTENVLYYYIAIK